MGYQEPENGEDFSEIVADYRSAVAEVYFPWPFLASGRPALGVSGGVPDWGCPERLKRNLVAIRAMGVKLDLLFNANCFGGGSISEKLKDQVCSVLDHLGGRALAPEIVTTASPFIAKVVRHFFPGTEIRASVNMRLDSTLAMEYFSGIFDSFYLKRDLQRNLKTVKLFSEWCSLHGKKLLLLANSGCLRNCPNQTFHDNLVAHDSELQSFRNVPGYQPHLCRQLFRDKKNMEDFLRGSWIRPEDVKRYEPYCSVMKLATRRHTHPRMVIDAYASGCFHGNLADLTEPGFSAEFAPLALMNDRFPENWTDIAGDCAVNCTHCGKCGEVLKQVAVKISEPFPAAEGLSGKRSCTG